MAQPQLMQVKLSRFDAQPWGFRLQGGVDYAIPLLVQKVNGGSLAEQAGLLPGDAVLKINDVDVYNLRHKDAQDIVVRSGNNFVITIQRGGSTWRPHVTPTGHLPQPNQSSPYLQTVTKTSLAHKQQDVQHIGSGYNNSARPFANGGDGNVKSIVNKQYNTPVGIYSDESIAETLSAQAEVLAGGVLGVNFKKNEREYQADKSEVLKFLREEETGQSTPAFSSHLEQQQQYQQQQKQQQQQQQQQQQYQQQAPSPQQQYQQSSTRHVNAPINTPKPPSTGGLPTGGNICVECERLITGVFVRIKDKNLHVECFKCATCGTSLKNQGYYNFNNKLYCEIHAKLAAMQNPPSGTEGYVPVPIKPNTKLSANTISSALSAHGFNGIGVANGSSTPTPAPAPVASAAAAATPTPTTVNTATIDYSSSNNDPSVYSNMSAALPPYGAASAAQPAAYGSSGDQPFEYVTLTGNVIRSVVPPGKGVNASYRVNQGYARPFGAAGPPAAAPKSPVIYPPQQQQWNVPQQQQKPAGNAYATLPRTPVGPQDAYESLEPQYAEERYEQPLPAGAEYFEDDPELVEANRQTRANFAWPPPRDDSHATPTAAPLYIAPPETQHVVAKPLQQAPVPPDAAAGGEAETSAHEPQATAVVAQPQWQSRSAPQLGHSNGLQAPPEIESSSDSYTSTSTTTTTTSEEYQRMYAAQVQAYQMQQAYEQSGSELDYTMDMELAAMQQSQQDQFYLNTSEYLSGRRSAQECADTLSVPLNTYKLIDMVREVTPSPIPPSNSQGPRHVVFADEPEIKEVPNLQQASETAVAVQVEQLDAHNGTQVIENATSSHSIEEEEEQESDVLIIEDRSNILQSQRIFQPTPEIIIDIPPVRQIPPTKIPNPTPKEWINPMVRVLTTASEVPFHLSDCPCPKPCDCKCEVDVELAKPQPPPPPPEPPAPPIPVPPKERPPSPVAPLRESPPRGSYMTKAMSTAPEFTVRFAPAASETIPLPEETEPYMPPPIDMKPYYREDYRPKSPFLSALTTAPDKPFESQFDRDVPIHLIDLPTPKEHLTMSDALRTASDRAYTPLNPENAMNLYESEQKEKEKKKYEFQVLDHEQELGVTPVGCELGEPAEYYKTERQAQRKSSAFAAMQAFQPSREPLLPNTTTTYNNDNNNNINTNSRHSITSLTQGQADLEYEKYCHAQERNQKRLDYFHKKEEELQQQQQQTQQQEHTQTNNNNTCQATALLTSCTKASSSSNSSSTVQQKSNTNNTYASSSTQASRSNTLAATKTATWNTYETAATTSSKIEAHELIEETAAELEHSEVLFPPPSPLSHLRGKPQSGLHKADTIPKYQRNWTALPTQSPIRTPEPQELRDNVPLAFVDAPNTNSENVASTAGADAVHKSVVTTSSQQQTTAAASRSSITSASAQRQQQSSSLLATQPPHKPTIPIIIEDRSGPVTMAFQSLDEHLQPDQSQTPSRPYTPSLSNKPAPIVPFYQTPEKLCFEECPATQARAYDLRAASPFPDRTRSPAPGPPPNPLAAIRAPRMKESEPTTVAPRVLQAGSITTGQSYLGAQQAQQQQQGQVLSHHETKQQQAMQSYTQQPELVQQQTLGDLTIQRRQQESRLEEQKQSQLQSQTTTQIGNTQIERRRKVTEEFEHTQSAKTVEIRTSSAAQATATSASTERRQSYGKTGFVAHQARRLSGLEEEITNLTSQSQAISARAAQLTADSTFPQLRSPEPQSKFPTKPVLPAHGEPAAANYVLPAAAHNKMVGPPPGFQEQQSGAHATSLATQQQQHQQQQKSLMAHSSTTTTTTSSSSQANAVSCHLTKASATNNQASAGADATAGGTCAASASNSNNVSNYAYRPNASAGISGNKPPQASAAAAAATIAALSAKPAQPPQPAAAAAAPTAPNLSDNTNVGGSTGAGGKGGAFGTTSAPKRGRGIMNKAVQGSNVRIPLCSSCHIQIRGPFITALGRIWCPEHFICVNANCRRHLQDIGFVEEKGDLYCEYCFEKYLAPSCSRCGGKIKGDCLNAIGKHFHPECFTCGHCGKLFGNTPFFLEDGNAYCEADWNELFTTKCFACGFPVEAGDRWVEALNHNYHSQCFNCTYCKQNLEGQSFYNKGGRPFCKNHAR